MSETAKIAAGLLREAANLVEGARDEEYGDFIDNAKTAGDYAGVDSQTATEVMIGFKIARLRHSPKHHDSIVDKLGYYALLEALRLRGG